MTQKPTGTVPALDSTSRYCETGQLKVKTVRFVSLCLSATALQIHLIFLPPPAPVSCPQLLFGSIQRWCPNGIVATFVPEEIQAGRLGRKLRSKDPEARAPVSCMCMYVQFPGGPLPPPRTTDQIDETDMYIDYTGMLLFAGWPAHLFTSLLLQFLLYRPYSTSFSPKPPTRHCRGVMASSMCGCFCSLGNTARALFLPMSTRSGALSETCSSSQVAPLGMLSKG